MKNRISSITRWPMDLDQVIERAQRDLGFVGAMRRLGIRDESLTRIATKAASMYSQAQEDFLGGANTELANWQPKKPR
jgi:hypothetical protein